MRYVLQTLGTIFAMGLASWLPQKLGFTITTDTATEAVEVQLASAEFMQARWIECEVTRAECCR